MHAILYLMGVKTGKTLCTFMLLLAKTHGLSQKQFYLCYKHIVCFKY